MNVSKPKSDTLTDLTNVAVPVSYSTLTGMAMVLSDSSVSDQKITPKARLISTADFASGSYSFAVPTGYVAAPYQLPMMEPQTWNVVADVITAHQPVALYQIGSKSYVNEQGTTVAADYMDSTFPIVIYPSDYILEGTVISPMGLNQSVTVRIYKNTGVDINWTGGNVTNNGMTDEVIRAATELTFVVTNVGGVYTITDWVTPDVVLAELGSEKTKAKTSMTAMINEVYDLTLRGQAAGGDLTGTYPNPTIAPNTISTDKIQDGAITLQKMSSEVIPCKISEIRKSYHMAGNIFGDDYLPCDGSTVPAICTDLNSACLTGLCELSILDGKQVTLIKYIPELETVFYLTSMGDVIYSGVRSWNWQKLAVSAAALNDVTYDGTALLFATGEGRLARTVDWKTIESYKVNLLYNATHVWSDGNQTFVALQSRDDKCYIYIASNNDLEYMTEMYSSAIGQIRLGNTTYGKLPMGGESDFIGILGSKGLFFFTYAEEPALDPGINYIYHYEYKSLIYDGTNYCVLTSEGLIFKILGDWLEQLHPIANPNDPQIDGLCTDLKYTNNTYFLLCEKAIFSSSDLVSWEKIIQHKQKTSTLIEGDSIYLWAYNNSPSPAYSYWIDTYTIQLPNIPNAYIRAWEK